MPAPSRSRPRPRVLPVPTQCPDPPAAAHTIRRLQVVGGFLNGLSLELAAGLNCIIGARGTGKTTVLELVRYALGNLPDSQSDPAGRRRIEALVERNLDGGRVELTVQTKEGLSYIVSRVAGEAPLVLTEDRQPTDIHLTDGGVFKADIYSQNEVESIADRTVSQLDLIDNFEAEAFAEIQLIGCLAGQNGVAGAYSGFPSARERGAAGGGVGSRAAGCDPQWWAGVSAECVDQGAEW